MNDKRYNNKKNEKNEQFLINDPKVATDLYKKP